MIDSRNRNLLPALFLKQEDLVFRIGTLPLFYTRRVSNLRSTAIRVTARIGKTNVAAKYHSLEISDESGAKRQLV